MLSEESIYTALDLLKTRLNRADHELDEYLEARTRSAAEHLEKIGIRLEDTIRDIMLTVDYAAWSYLNRDSGGTMPEWLRLMRRERWLEGVKGAAQHDT